MPKKAKKSVFWPNFRLSEKPIFSIFWPFWPLNTSKNRFYSFLTYENRFLAKIYQWKHTHMSILLQIEFFDIFTLKMSALPLKWYIGGA